MQHVTVILYGPTGNRLALGLARWLAILDLAVQCRWKAAGTIAPPVQFDEEDGRVLRPKCWTGDYRTPAGQTVTRADASRMATALGSSVQAQADSALVEFLTFCEQGGFTISSGAAQSCATHDLDALAHAAARPPISAVERVRPIAFGDPNHKDTHETNSNTIPNRCHDGRVGGSPRTRNRGKRDY